MDCVRDVFGHREASNEARVDVKDHHGIRDWLINYSNGVVIREGSDVSYVSRDHRVGLWRFG
jgi:hypothetical protein